MKISFLLILPVFSVLTSLAQDETEYKEASKESQAYHDYRMKVTRPPYGIEKVLSLIAKIKDEDLGSEEYKSALSPKVYASLTLREKFTYNMVHGESYSQNCDAVPPIQDEQKKIFGHLPDLFGESSWTDSQEKFFINNSDTVVKLIKESVLRSKRMGLNYKHAIIVMNAIDMIPFLVSTYNTDRKDHDILTVLILLMKENKYQPFIASASHQKLYESKGDYSYYFAHIVLNKANEDLVIQRATEFYNGWRK